MSGYDRPAVAVAIEVNHMLFSHYYILLALGAIVASLFVYRSFIPFCAVYSDLDMPRQRESTVFQNARPGVWLDHLGPPQKLPSPQSSAASPSPAPTAVRQTLRSCGNPLALRRRRRHQVPRAHRPRLSRPPRRILLIWIVRAPETLRVDPPRSCIMTICSLSLSMPDPAQRAVRDDAEEQQQQQQQQQQGDSQPERDGADGYWQTGCGYPG